VRTVFLGTSEFAASLLESLADEHAPGSARHRPALVITRPDRPAGRGRKLLSPAVADTARALGIELAQPPSVNDEATIALLARVAPQAVIVCAFGALIKEPLLSSYELLNVHPSLLARWRGAAPIERAIMAGDERTGVSIMRVSAGLDSGPVCRAASEQIHPDDSYGTLAPRLRQIASELLADTLDARQRGETLTFVEQDERLATYAEKITPPDRLLDPGRPAVELERTVRALHPHIGARAALPDGTLIGVHRARLYDPGPQHATGVYAEDGHLLLGCTAGALELLDVRPPGKRAMDAGSFLRGHGLPDA
jgi:methionyl-tRNA formyltransferase